MSIKRITTERFEATINELVADMVAGGYPDNYVALATINAAFQGKNQHMQIQLKVTCEESEFYDDDLEELSANLGSDGHEASHTYIPKLTA